MIIASTSFSATWDPVRRQAHEMVHHIAYKGGEGGGEGAGTTLAALGRAGLRRGPQSSFMALEAQTELLKTLTKSEPPTPTGAPDDQFRKMQD